MSLEALWTVEPFLPDGTAGLRGVAVLETGRILGGDHGSVWVGTWTVENRLLKFKAHVTHYAPDVISLVRPDLREVNYEGELAVPGGLVTELHGKVRVVEAPGIEVTLLMRRVAELP